MQEHINSVELSKMIIYGTSALFGGLVHALIAQRKGLTKNIFDLIILAIISGFAGAMWILVAIYFSPNNQIIHLFAGGMGGYQYLTSQTVTATTYTITVGAGGAGSTAVNLRGSAGGDSQFGALTASVGGGGGGSDTGNGSQKNGGNGGSGGGGSYATSSGGTGTGATGNAGGSGGGPSKFGAGGGGGASAVGANGSGTAGGNGGNGTANSITGSSVTYAGGGGGGQEGGTASTGGSGGGGAGSTNSSAGSNGTANRGGGGGGGGFGGGAGGNGGTGGSGVVIVRLLTSDWGTITGGTQTTDGSYTVCTFNSSGSLVLAASSSINSNFLMFM